MTRTENSSALGSLLPESLTLANSTHKVRLAATACGDAAAAGHRVGYESPSQFSREYSRLFGAPPSRDLQRLRQGGSVATSTA